MLRPRNRAWHGHLNLFLIISDIRPFRLAFSVFRSSFILNGIWWFVVRGSWSSFFMHLQYCTVVLICCTCAVNKNTRRATGTRRDTQHGHKKGTHPRASQGRALRCYERSKHIAPKPRIARAPELVSCCCNNAKSLKSLFLKHLLHPSS